MDKLEDKSKRRADSHARLLALDSKVYQAVLEMERATFGNGELSKRIKELIAVDISVVINCESCMQWHIEQTVKAGASRLSRSASRWVEDWRPRMRASPSTSWPMSFQLSSPHLSRYRTPLCSGHCFKNVRF